MLLVLALSASAQAAITHLYSGTSFGPEGVGKGNFGVVEGLAVDQKNGDVLVYTFTEGGSLYKFNPAGEPIDFSSSKSNVIEGIGNGGLGEQQVAIDESSGPDAGDIYVAIGNSVRIYAESGAYLGELNGAEMCGVAVDASGDVYVGIYSGTVERFAPVTNPVSDSDEDGSMGGLHNPCNLALDKSDDIYTADWSGGVYKYEALQFGSPSATGTLLDENGKTLAVDSSSKELLVDETNRISQYDASVEPATLTGTTGATGEGTLNLSYGLDVNRETGKLYVGDESKVEIFGPPVTVAGVNAEAASGVSSSAATLHGTVEPAGTEVTKCVFEYGTEMGALNHTISCAPATPYKGTTPVAATAHPTGLEPSSTYHYRIAATDSAGTVYSNERTFGTLGPPTILGANIGRVRQHTAEVQLAIAPHGVDTHYEIEYGTSTEYGSKTASVDVGSEEEVVYANPEITGLALGTTYHFRVIARNAEGKAESADQSFTTPPAATIREESDYHVGTTTVTFGARVNDYETAGVYYYEYGTTTAYGSDTPSQELVVVEGFPATNASVTGLTPSTTYHFRIVVEAEGGTEYGPDISFTTKPSTAPALTLPDGRSYEKVSPNANANGDVIQDEPESLAIEGGWTWQPFVVSPDGSAVAYMGDPSELGGTGEEGGGEGNQYVARRNADGGWSTQNVEPPSGSISEQTEYQGFSEDLSAGFLLVNSKQPLAEGAPGEGYKTLYKKTFATGAYESLLKVKPPHRKPNEFRAVDAEDAYAGSSANLAHELFMANDALTSNAVDGGEEENNLYDVSGGTTTLVNVLPDGSTEPNAVFGGPSASENSQRVILPHDISEDGSRIFWTDINTHDLYVRENDTAPQSPIAEGKCTVTADACTVLIAEDAQFWNATPDGSKVLYIKGGDLYEQEIGGEAADLVSGAEVAGVLASSNDLSYVYFVAKGALAGEAKPQTCEAGETASENALCNLYALHVGEPIRYIGALHGKDDMHFPEYSGDWTGDPGHSNAEVTPDGTHLLFASISHMTGFESKQSEEVYVYDFSTNTINCVSCNPDGESIENNEYGSPLSAYLPPTNLGSTGPHLISDDGDRVFFDDLTSLVSQDTNNRTDVYEWERDGTGSCALSPGCIYMLSDGTSPEGSFLIGASTSGDDVFFTTRAKLVSEDENENIDVYDARVDAYIPPAPTTCTGTGCQGEASLPPVFATPPSTTYEGVGNLEPTPAASTKAATKPLTRAQKLAKALKTCRKKAKKKRASCEKQARSKYGAKAKKSSARHSNAKTASGRGK